MHSSLKLRYQNANAPIKITGTVFRKNTYAAQLAPDMTLHWRTPLKNK